jgi:hypothetical protein
MIDPHTSGIKGSSIHTQFLREMAETSGLLLKFSIPQRRDVQRGQVWLALLGASLPEKFHCQSKFLDGV